MVETGAMTYQQMFACRCVMSICTKAIQVEQKHKEITNERIERFVENFLNTPLNKDRYPLRGKCSQISIQSHEIICLS